MSLLIPTISYAQSYTIDWYKVSGGGGTSTGGTYQVSGTIGQHDAGGPMTGGNYLAHERVLGADLRRCKHPARRRCTSPARATR